MTKVFDWIRKYTKQLTCCGLIGATILFCGYIYFSGLQGDDSYYVIKGFNSFVEMVQSSFDATVVYYQTWNGRFIVNFINILIVNCGMVVQTIAVILILIWLLYSIYRLLPFKVNFATFGALIIFLMLIGSDDFLFNASCLNIVCNYLLPIPFYLMMVKTIVKDEDHYSFGQMILLCGLALVSGSLIETYGFALALLVIVMVLTRQFHLNIQKTIIGLFYAIGVLTLLLCPGSFSRSDVLYDGLLGLVYRANGIVGCFSDWMILPLLSFGLTMALTNTKIKSLTSIEKTLLLYALLQVVVMCIAPYFPPRALLMVNFILFAISIHRASLHFKVYSVLIITGVVCSLALCGQLTIALGRIIFAG